MNEIIALVNVALGTGTLATCEAGDGNGDLQITINEIVTAVNNALSGCQPESGQPLKLESRVKQSHLGLSEFGAAATHPVTIL